MKWRVLTSKNAEKFIKRNRLPMTDVLQLISKTIRYLQGENSNINVKKLKGEWRGFFRIRIGRIRIIAEFNFDDSVVFIEEIDWRGNIY